MSDSLTYLVVKGTLALLALASALTWALIVVKAIQQLAISRQNRAFLRAFEKTVGLPSTAEIGKFPGAVARVALAGVESWDDVDGEGEGAPDRAARRDLLELTLRQQTQRERRVFESGLPVLASIGATAPFVGLFGTVFGIIHALQRISGAGSASLDVVAGPIGEALVATGVGIAVAVPAVLAYNFFIRRTKSVLADVDDFSSVLVVRALRSTFRSRARLDSKPGARETAAAFDLRGEAST